MSFAYPAFLSALALLVIPIVIHLFNFKKYKRILFSDIRFLKEIQEKTKKRSQLKYLIVLACRILAFSFLIFAFAQPFSGNTDDSSPNKIYSIYIDNSKSMDALGKNGKLTDVARQKIESFVKSTPENTRFQLLTNEFSLSSQRLLSKEEIGEQLELIQSSPISRSAQEVITRQNELIKLHPEASVRIIHVSDFQKSYFNYENIQLKLPISLIQLNPQERSNISVDSVWFNNPLHVFNGNENFYFRLTNHDPSQEKSITLQLVLNDQQKAVTTVTIPPQSSIDSSFNYTNTQKGIIQGKLQFNDEQIPFDDVMYFSYKILPYISTSAICSTQKSSDTILYPVKSVFVNDSYYRFESFNQQNTDYGKFPQKDFIILNQLKEISSGLSQEIEKFVSSGGSICIIPRSSFDKNSYNELIGRLGAGSFSELDTNTTPTTKPDFDDAFFKGIFEKKPNEMDVPIVRKHFTLLNNVKTLTHTLLLLKNGNPLITQTNYKKGKVYLITTTLENESGNFAQHALFVPILLRMAELSAQSGNLYCVFGKDDSFEIKPIAMGNDEVFNLVAVDGKENYIPAFRNNGSDIQIFFNENILNAGNYFLKTGTITLDGTSINYDRKESDMVCYSKKELQENLSASGIKSFKIVDDPEEESNLSISSIDTTQKYWTICIWIMLLFLLLETLLLKIWQRA